MVDGWSKKSACKADRSVMTYKIMNRLNLENEESLCTFGGPSSSKISESRKSHACMAVNRRKVVLLNAIFEDGLVIL